MHAKTKCTATTASGQPCKAWAIHGTEPPRCAAHGGASKKPGAPIGNTNAKKHGFYAALDATTQPDDITDLVAAEIHRYNALGDYFDALLAETEKIDPHLLNMYAVLSQTAGRITRMMRDKHIVSGEAADGLAGAIAQTLEEVGNIMGVQLVP